MANMTKNATTGKYELEITPSTSAQTKTIKTSGKYCDADIDVKISAVATATWGTSNSGTLVATVTPNTSSDQYVNVTQGFVEASKIKIPSISFGGYSVNASRTTISNTSNTNLQRYMAAIFCDSGGTYVFYYKGSQVTSATLAPGAIVYNDGSNWKFLNVGSSSATTITSGTAFLGIRKSSSSGTYRVRIIATPILD